MVDIQLGNKINEGSNSYIYEVSFEGEDYVAKIPKEKVRYISFYLQVKAMKKVLRYKDKINFKVPNVVYYSLTDKNYGEILIMEKMKNIYPIDFMIRQQLVDYQFIVVEVAKAIAFLHSISISGYDIEFFWDVLENKLVLLDINQEYTIGYTTQEMLKNTFEMEIHMQNTMGMWNISSCILEKQAAIKVYETNAIHSVTLEDLNNQIEDNSVQLHIENVAKSHYIQVICSINKAMRTQATQLYLNTYKRSCVSSDFQKALYLSCFEKANKKQIKSCTVKLYYSKNETISVISNSNQVDE